MIEQDHIDLEWGRFAFRRSGSGSPLLLLHSLALSGHMWDPVHDEFAAEHDVITIDFRGHGDSGSDGQPFSALDLAGDLDLLLTHLKLPRAHVLGVSMGGSVATVFAASYTDRINRLVLCDTSAWYGPDAPSAWAAREVAAMSTPRELLVPFQTDRWFSDEARRTQIQLVSHVVRIFLRTSPQAHAGGCRMLGGLDSREILGDISAPTLIVTGEQDYATPPYMGEVLGTAIPDATFHIWRGLRHFAILESPALRWHVLTHLRGEINVDPAVDGTAPCCLATANHIEAPIDEYGSR